MSEAERSPQETRALLERSYARSYGKDAGDPEIQRQVIADLELVDAVDRAGELHARRAPAPDVEPARGYTDRDKPAELADAERETGMRLLEDHERGEPVLSREVDANPILTSERWAMAGGRIGRILEGMGGSSDFRVAARNAAIPELALEYTETYSYFMTRHTLHIIGRDHNPFRGMSDADAVRALVAKVYDICDRSTGKLGWWYVK